MAQTQKQKEWYLAHKDKMKQYQKEWYQKHKKKHDEKSKKWVEEHPEQIKEYSNKSYEKRKVLMQEQFKEKYYGENSEEFRRSKRNSSRIRKHKLKTEFIKKLGGKCSICGLEYNGENGSVFDFHHINPQEKDANPSKLLSCSKEKIEKELEKCILVCSNCHRLIHNSKY